MIDDADNRRMAVFYCSRQNRTINYWLCEQYLGAEMRKFISYGTAFYMLDPGERLTKQEIYHRYDPVRFVIWPRGEKWDTLERVGNKWVRLTDRLFDTENEAFRFAYESYCADEERKSRP